jgi:uncharacterized membrane protein
MNGERDSGAVLSALGCVGLAVVLLLTCLMPYFLLETMQTALLKLRLSPQLALVVVFGILIGGMVNVPVYRIRREQQQVVETLGVYGVWGWSPPQFRRFRPDTIIAINVGGCVIPLVLVAWEIWHLVPYGRQPLAALFLVALGNIVVSYLAARPVQGVGITMPGLLSPLTSVCLTWLLLLEPQFEAIRPPVAFVAGVLGPLVGADLLHLKDMRQVSAGMLSIGGAGTFDGIVLSGILAAFLA